MKRLLAIVLSLAMLLGLVACGSKQNEENSEKTNEISMGLFQVPFQKMYVNTPPLQYKEEVFTHLFMEEKTKYIALTYLSKKNETDEKAAWETTFNYMVDKLSKYHKINLLDEVEETSKEVNGIKTYCIKGTVNCGESDTYNAYIYGYSFVFNNNPCSIVGVVQDPVQLQEEIDNITEIVDAMMASVRSEI